MKHLFNVLCLTISLTSGFVLQAAAYHGIPKRTPEPGPHMPKALAAQISKLETIFEKDDVAALKTFIKNNPTPPFQWNETYSHLPWPTEAQTPLSAATWFGSYNCVKYLLKNKDLNIKESFTIPSSRGFSALHYADNPPAKKYRKSPHQTNANYTKIVAILKKHGAKK